MKITGSVTKIKDCGDFMEIEMQGRAVTDPDWFGLHVQTVRINATERNKRAYWLGREVEICITPQGRS